jgi:exosortase A-associated hydrolase 2
MLPFFAPWGSRGQRFGLWHAPASPPRGLVVQVHAFAEEANKCRRMAARQARALAGAGWAVLQFDLLGCGDSDGDFGDAGWDDWVDDVVLAVDVAFERWIAAWPQHPLPRRPILWSQRAGSLIAVAAAARCRQPPDLLFWQPAGSGKQVLQQFLRLKLAAGLDGAAAKAIAEGLRASLAAGEAVEIAGYRLSAALARGLEAATLAPPPELAGGPCRVHWLEVAAREQPSLLPASEPILARWREAGHDVRALAVRGPAFWATVEMEEAPALLEATLEALSEPRVETA